MLRTVELFKVKSLTRLHELFKVKSLTCLHPRLGPEAFTGPPPRTPVPGQLGEGAVRGRALECTGAGALAPAALCPGCGSPGAVLAGSPGERQARLVRERERCAESA